MATTTSATTLRIDSEDKNEATDILRSMGISFNGYVSMAVKQLINQRRIPFEILPSDHTPTEETRLAMLHAEAKAAGIIADTDPAYHDVGELMAALEE